MTLSKKKKWVIAGIVIVYLAIGVHFYVSNLVYSRLAVQVCDPLAVPIGEFEIEELEAVMMTPGNCEMQKIDILGEIPTALYMTFLWPVVIFRYGMFGEM